MNLPLSSRNRAILGLFVLLLVVTFVSLLPVLKNGFLEWDDTVYLTKNPVLLRLDAQNFANLVTAKVEQIYVPLVLVSFAVENHFFGLNPFVFHLDNLLLHLGIVALVFWFALRCGLSHFAAFGGALIFAIHPMHVESVAWVSERKDLLYTIFYLGALHAYGRYCRKPGPGYFLLSMVLGALSVLSKPMALSLPLVMAACDWLWRRTFSRRLVIEKLAHFLYIIPVVWITYSMNARVPVKDVGEAVLLWVWSLVFYVGKFAVPNPLLALYDTPRPITIVNPVYAGSFVLLGLLIYSLWRFRHNRLWLFAWGYYFLSIFFLLRLDTRIDLVMVADHYMYLPSLGFCIWAGAAAEQVLQVQRERNLGRYRAGFAALFVIVLLMALTTFRQGQMWADEREIWTKVLRYYPSSIAHDSLGLYDSNHGRYDEAIAEHTAALAIVPHDAIRTYNNRGLAYMRKGEFVKAIADFTQTIALDPTYKVVYLNRGLSYEQNGERDLAMADYTRAIALNPFHVEAYYARGLLYYQQGQKDLALQDLTRAVTINPKYTLAYFVRGQIYGRARQFDLALSDFNTVLRFEPRHAKALTQRGLVRRGLGDPAGAEADFLAALAIDPAYMPARDNLQRMKESKKVMPK